MGLTLDPRDMLGSPDMQLPWRGKWYVDSTDSFLVLLALKPRVKIKCYDCFFALVTVRTKRQSRGPAFPLIHPTSPVKKMQFSVLFRIVPQHRKTNTFWVPRTQTPSTDSTRIQIFSKTDSFFMWKNLLPQLVFSNWICPSTQMCVKAIRNASFHLQSMRLLPFSSLSRSCEKSELAPSYWGGGGCWLNVMLLVFICANLEP